MQREIGCEQCWRDRAAGTASMMLRTGLRVCRWVRVGGIAVVAVAATTACAPPYQAPQEVATRPPAVSYTYSSDDGLVEANGKARAYCSQYASTPSVQGSISDNADNPLESANIKLGQVATNVLGTSGRLMVQALADGEEDAQKLALLARGKLRIKIAQLRQALTGCVTPTHRFLLKELLQQYDQLHEGIMRIHAQSQRHLDTCADPWAPQAVALLQSIPGVGQRVAKTLVAACGTARHRFPTDAHLASGAGRCPGHHQSAGTQLSGTTRKGNVDVRGALTQAAWTATRTKHTYLAAQFRRLTTRLDTKQALVTVGHRMLVIAWHLLARRTIYKDLGGDYFDRCNAHVYRRKLIRKREALGLTVTIEPHRTLSEAPA